MSEIEQLVNELDLFEPSIRLVSPEERIESSNQYGHLTDVWGMDLSPEDFSGTFGFVFRSDSGRES